MQLEDGSTAYIQHTVHMPQSNTILAIQADGTIADLQAEATALDPETISVLEQYTTKVKLLPRWACVVWRACHVTQNQDQGVCLCLYFMFFCQFKSVFFPLILCRLSGGEYREPPGLLWQSGSRQWRPHAGREFLQVLCLFLSLPDL